MELRHGRLAEQRRMRENRGGRRGGVRKAECEDKADTVLDIKDWSELPAQLGKPKEAVMVRSHALSSLHLSCLIICFASLPQRTSQNTLVQHADNPSLPRMSAPLFRLRGGFNSGVSYEEEDGSSADESFDSNEIVFKDPNVQKDFERFCSNGVISHIDSELEGKLKADNSSTADADDSRWQGNHTSVMGAANMTRKDSASMHLRGGTRSKARPGASGVKKQQGREQISISFIGSILQSLRGVTTLFSRRKPLQEEAGNERASGRGQGECESRYAEDSKASLPETRSSLIKKGRKQNYPDQANDRCEEDFSKSFLRRHDARRKRRRRRTSQQWRLSTANGRTGVDRGSQLSLSHFSSSEFATVGVLSGRFDHHVDFGHADEAVKPSAGQVGQTKECMLVAFDWITCTPDKPPAFNTLSIKLLLNHSSAKDEPEDAQWEVRRRRSAVFLIFLVAGDRAAEPSQ
eukprot:762958-Hanusia_phi.AAC.9